MLQVVVPFLVISPFLIAYAFAIAGTQGKARTVVATFGAVPILVLLYFALVIASGDGR